MLKGERTWLLGLLSACSVAILASASSGARAYDDHVTTWVALPERFAFYTDDTVERWLPGVISNGEDISIRRLLNHTSGIYDYAGDPAALAPYMQGDLTHVFDIRAGRAPAR